MTDLTYECDGRCGDESPHDAHLTDAGKAALSIAPAKFDSVPVTIEAFCWVGGAAAATPVIDWVLENGGTATWMEAHTVPMTEKELEERGLLAGALEVPEVLTIRTLEGDMRAAPGDWIIRGTEGEFYPCKPSVFNRKYKAHTKEKN